MVIDDKPRICADYPDTVHARSEQYYFYITSAVLRVGHAHTSHRDPCIVPTVQSCFRHQWKPGPGNDMVYRDTPGGGWRGWAVCECARARKHGRAHKRAARTFDTHGPRACGVCTIMLGRCACVFMFTSMRIKRALWCVFVSA